jgi:D-alanyl-D-alanine carboxypeptidase
MGLGFFSSSHRLAAIGLLASLSLVATSWDHVEARTARHSKETKQSAKKQTRHRVVHGPNYSPPYAAIVVDAYSDQVLHEENPDAPRHPASLTKIMTLYMLFEQIEAGKFKLDSPLQISAHAAAQTPTKLGLKANQTITVEDAIKGMVTRSANDAAVVVGEAVGGTEPDFANLMTEKARALGMANTTYVNASGLPAEEQITTARDQAVLGRAVQDRFPTFYRYFSLPSFRYRNTEIRNHNGLLGNVKGVDGIKTGYTEASGYNLVASVHRDDKHIVAVVLGGKSNAKRDARMRELIEAHITHAAVRRTAPTAAPTADSGAGASPTLASDKAEPAETKRRGRKIESQSQTESARSQPRTARANATVRLPASAHSRATPNAQGWWWLGQRN